MPVVTRPIEPDDTPGVIALLRSVYAEFSDELRIEENPFLQDIGGFFRAEGGDFWTALDGDRVVGVCGLLLHADAGEVTSIYVDASLRGQHLGRCLLLLAIEHAIRAGKPQLYLWSDVRFERAHRFYLSLGFVQLPGRRALGDSLGSIEFAFVLDF